MKIKVDSSIFFLLTNESFTYPPTINVIISNVKEIWFWNFPKLKIKSFVIFQVILVVVLCSACCIFSTPSGIGLRNEGTLLLIICLLNLNVWILAYYRVFGKVGHTESGSNLIDFWPEILQKSLTTTIRFHL